MLSLIIQDSDFQQMAHQRNLFFDHFDILNGTLDNATGDTYVGAELIKRFERYFQKKKKKKKSKANCKRGCCSSLITRKEMHFFITCNYYYTINVQSAG